MTVLETLLFMSPLIVGFVGCVIIATSEDL